MSDHVRMDDAGEDSCGSGCEKGFSHQRGDKVAGAGLRITTVRIIVQSVMFALFLAFVVVTTFTNLNRHPNLHLWVSKVLEVDPLIALSTALTTHTIYKGLLWSLVILVPTFFLGRFFCGWICPYGALHHFVGWAFGGLRGKKKADANAYRPMYRFKYYLLAAMLVAAALGQLQIGLLDPICLLYRSITSSVVPALSMCAQGVLDHPWLHQVLPADLSRTAHSWAGALGDPRLHQGGWLLGAILFFLVAMNLVIPRFFCRALCPLGALLGLCSRWSWWRIERDEKSCNQCNQCPTSCEGACDPHKDLRKSECFVCFNCIEDCPSDGLRFAFMPPRERVIAGPDVRRRSVLVGALAGLLFHPFARASGATTRNFSSKVIRPPGTVEELEFLERCIKCAQCIRVCPTNVLQPAWAEAGVEGLWTPVMNYRMGHCQFNCTACGQVCPTGAIRRITIDEKHGAGQFAGKGAIKLGTAHFDVGRCLPYSKNIPCVVCEEVCPTSPKAIWTERQMRNLRTSRKLVVGSKGDAVTLAEIAATGGLGERASFRPDQFRGDETTPFYVAIRHLDGATETHRIMSNDADTLRIDGRFGRPPAAGATAVLQVELKVPHVSVGRCIGCGLCERECPVVGDRRAVYVTPEGESRSQDCGERDRNRSLRLQRG